MFKLDRSLYQAFYHSVQTSLSIPKFNSSEVNEKTQFSFKHLTVSMRSTLKLFKTLKQQAVIQLIENVFKSYWTGDKKYTLFKITHHDSNIKTR